MRYIYLFFGLLCLGSVSAQELRLTKGVVNENLKLSDSLEETFSLYVPEDFEGGQIYKALFILDPDGNGLQIARLFSSQILADDFIVAANNWTVGDDLDANATKFFTMLNAITKSIPLNENHIYAAGLDNGAQVVSALPYVVNGFSGILTVNDIFMKYDERKPSKDEILVGLIANASPDYYKMQNAFSFLEDRNNENLLLEYEGEDGWPIADYLASAFNSLYFKVLEKSDEDVPEKLLQQSFKRDSATAEILRRKRQFLVAYDYIDHLKDKYRGKLKLRPLRDQIQNVRRSTGYRNARKASKRNEEDELILRSDLGYFLEEDIATANYDNLAYWDQRKMELDSASENAGKPQEQRVARRLKGLIESTMETYETVYKSKAFNLNQALFFNILKTIFDPKDYQSYKNVISLAAMDKDPETANFYLEKMLKNGYKDYESLYNIPDTEVLHISDEFNEIVEKYFDKSKF